MSVATPVQTPPPAVVRPTDPEPMWNVAHLFRSRGNWIEADYFLLNTNRLVELVAGSIEVLPGPTELHQDIAYLFCTRLKAHVADDPAARVRMAPFAIRLWENQIRQPDVVYMAGRNAHRRHGNVWDGADLAVEVVSGSSTLWPASPSTGSSTRGRGP